MTPTPLHVAAALAAALLLLTACGGGGAGEADLPTLPAAAAPGNVPATALQSARAYTEFTVRLAAGDAARAAQAPLQLGADGAPATESEAPLALN